LVWLLLVPLDQPLVAPKVASAGVAALSAKIDAAMLRWLIFMLVLAPEFKTLQPTGPEMAPLQQ
jgi:hypothetical protein